MFNIDTVWGHCLSGGRRHDPSHWLLLIHCSDVSLPSQASSTRSGRSSRMSSVLTTSDKRGQHRPADPRFAAGSTTRSSFRDLSAYNEEARPQSVKPISSLRMEGEFSRSVSSKEHFQPPAYSRTPATIRKSMMDVPKGKKLEWFKNKKKSTITCFDRHYGVQHNLSPEHNGQGALQWSEKELQVWLQSENSR